MTKTKEDCAAAKKTAKKTKIGNGVTRGYGLMEGFLAKKRAAIADEHIPERSRSGAILDIGCGTTPYFLMNTQFAKKFGVDPHLGREKCAGITLDRFDVEKNRRLPFCDASFDAVTMLAVFEHIEQKNLNNVLKEIRRVLKPGGRFIMTTPCTWTDSLLRTMAKARLVSPSEIDDHKGAYSHKDIRSILCKSGFEEGRIRLGYFELFLNIWAYADR
jgi:ubiquinone/menaquinone biosynthesis C-methylase UbiE